ncbi:hypothetical protein HB364_13505 [Pseudoflavitalea sp. X16]|uniref:hypothetical protein n=1 Tax=Paraflavitalea devenefica TaxID=2716334 RepID=UPI00141E340D|nr:hypothetical protein [Paraflavitalea devenefica]NII26105.1 hypothetical protein [Paraflavitalea devenefica]
MTGTEPLWLTWALKLFGPATTVGKWLRDRWEKNHYPFYHWMKSMGLDSEKKNFEVLYFNALKKFEKEVPGDLHGLFLLKEVREAYKDDSKKKGLKDGVRSTLGVQIHLNERLHPYRKSIDGTESRFRELLQKEILESLTPQEQHQEERFDGLQEKQDLTLQGIADIKTFAGAGLEGIKGSLSMITESISQAREGHAQELKLENQELRNTLSEKDTVIAYQAKTISDLVQGKLAGPLPPPTITLAENTKLRQEDFDGEIKDIIGLIDTKNNLAAITQLEKYKARKWEQLSDDQRYIILAHIGVAYFELGREEEAAPYFIQLPDLRPETAEAFGLAAMGYASTGDCKTSEKMAIRAVQIDPLSGHAAVARIRCLQGDASINDLEAITHEDLLKNPMVALAAVTYLNAHPAGYKVEALTLLERVTASFTPGSLSYYEATELKAIIITSRLLSESIKMGKIVDSQMKGDAAKAVTWFSEAWAYYSGNDLRTTKWHVLTNRGVARKLMADLEGAEHDFRLSLEVKQEYFTYRHLALLRYETDRDNLELIATIRKNIQLSADESDELYFLELSELFRLHRYNEILEIIDRPREFADPEAEGKINYFKVQVLLGKGDPKAALELARNFAVTQPADAFGHFQVADIYCILDDVPSAQSSLEEAISHLTPDHQPVFRFMFAHLAMKLGDFESVVGLLNIEEVKMVPSVYSSWLLMALMETHQYEPAFQLAEKFYSESSPEVVAAQVLVHKHEQLGDFDAAEKIAVHTLKFFPNDRHLQTKLLAGLLRRNDRQNATLFLGSLPSDFDGADKIMLIQNAQLWAGHAAIDLALELAYEFRHQHPDDQLAGEAYIDYVRALHNQGYREFQPKSIIANNCFVQLQSANGNIVQVIIENTPTTGISHQEKSPIGKALMGKTVEQVIIISGQPYSIIQIVPKYLVTLNPKTMVRPSVSG